MSLGMEKAASNPTLVHYMNAKGKRLRDPDRERETERDTTGILYHPLE